MVDFMEPQQDPGDSEREKLAAYTGHVPWSYLAPHAAKGTLFFVDPALDLAATGAAISGNRTEQIATWLKSGDMVKIGELHAAQWQEGEQEFEALVVSPFVLCRPV